MNATYKPDDYTSGSPYLIVNGAAQTLEFLKRVFNATQLRHFPHPDGRIAHSEVRIDDTVIMLADGTDVWPALPSHVHIYVADVDGTYQKALDAGGVSVQAPKQNEGELDRRSGVKDPGGTTWWIATQQTP